MIVGTHQHFQRLSASSSDTTPLALIRSHRESDRWTLPTGSLVFRCGDAVDAIHVIEQGLVELDDASGPRVRYGPGELFFYEDLISPDQCHSRDARALTPLALIRLDRSGFLTLIHQHPTLVVDLIAQQHRRLRQQRADSRHVH